MQTGVIIAWLCAVVWLETFPSRAQETFVPVDEKCGSMRLIPSDDIRMSPLAEPQRDPKGDVRTVSFDVPSSLSLSVRPREYSLSERLLNRDADPLAKGCEPSTALALALGLRDMKLLERMLDQGFDPNVPLATPVPSWLPGLFENPFLGRVLAKDTRVTPLMVAVLSEQIDAVRLLMRHGAKVETCTRTLHMYPLDFAAELKNIALMQLLLGREPTDSGQGRHMVISLYLQKGWLMNDAQVLFETKVSTGRAGFATRTGEYVVTQKYAAWKSTLYKAAMPNFMRLNCSQAGLHGGVVPGVPASHGCVRLPPSNAELFYSIMRLGDRVTIVE